MDSTLRVSPKRASSASAPRLESDGGAGEEWMSPNRTSMVHGLARVTGGARLSVTNQRELIDLFQQNPFCKCSVCIRLWSLYRGMTKEDVSTSWARNVNHDVKREPKIIETDRVNQNSYARDTTQCKGHNATQRAALFTSAMKTECDTGGQTKQLNWQHRSPRPVHDHVKEQITSCTVEHDHNRHTGQSEEHSEAERTMHDKTLALDKTKKTQEHGGRKRKVTTQQGQACPHCNTPLRVTTSLGEANDDCVKMGQLQSISSQKMKGADSQPYADAGTTNSCLCTSQTSNLNWMRSRECLSSDSFACQTSSNSGSEPCSEIAGQVKPTDRSLTREYNSRRETSTPKLQLHDYSPISAASELPLSDSSISDCSSDQNVSFSDSKSGSSYSDTPKARLGSKGDPKTLSLHPWRAGDLLWGRLTGYYWWPCMVCVDSEGDCLRVRSESRGLLTEYHVQYFGPARQTSWLRSTSLRKYEGRTQMRSWAYDELQKVKGQKCRSMQRSENLRKLRERFDPYLPYPHRVLSKRISDCLDAVEEASEAGKLKRRDRLDKYVYNTSSTESEGQPQGASPSRPNRSTSPPESSCSGASAARLQMLQAEPRTRGPMVTQETQDKHTCPRHRFEKAASWSGPHRSCRDKLHGIFDEQTRDC